MDTNAAMQYPRQHWNYWSLCQLLYVDLRYDYFTKVLLNILPITKKHFFSLGVELDSITRLLVDERSIHHYRLISWVDFYVYILAIPNTWLSWFFTYYRDRCSNGSQMNLSFTNGDLRMLYRSIDYLYLLSLLGWSRTTFKSGSSRFYQSYSTIIITNNRTIIIK